MPQKAKPKRKNLSPDDLLQEAQLLYPENEAFVRGDSKDLHPKQTIIANIKYRKYKISSTRGAEMTISLFAMFTIGFCGFLTSDLALSAKGIFPLLIAGSPALLFIGLVLYFLYRFWRFLGFDEKVLDEDYIELAKHGRLMFGEVTFRDKNAKSISILMYPPESSFRKFAYWHFRDDVTVKKGDKVIVLYVEDKLCIVL